MARSGIDMKPHKAAAEKAETKYLTLLSACPVVASGTVSEETATGETGVGFIKRPAFHSIPSPYLSRQSPKFLHVHSLEVLQPQQSPGQEALLQNIGHRLH